MTDKVMDGKFTSYGKNWMSYQKNSPNMNATVVYEQVTPRPGESFLPSVGFCDIHEALNDKRGIYIDK